MIYENMLPAGQVYTYDGIGDNDNFPALPSVINTAANSPLLEELMQVWLGRNRFVLLAQSSLSQLHRVSNNALVYANDLDASIRWIALMTRFQPKIDVTLHYVSSTRSLWADFPAFLRLIKLAYRYDMLLTVNGHFAKSQAPVVGNYRGVDIRFVKHKKEQALLLHLIGLSNGGKIRGWSMDRLGTELAACLERHNWSTTNPRVWKAVKRIHLPCNIEAFLGPHNLLYKTPHAAMAAIRAVNMGEEPDVMSFDNVWRMSLAVALGKWKQTLRTQLDIFNHSLWNLNYGIFYGTRDEWPTLTLTLGQNRVFGLYGDENLWLDFMHQGLYYRNGSRLFRRLQLGVRWKHRIYAHDFATTWGLAEQASGELYKTDIHLAALVLATNDPFQASSVTQTA